MSSPNHAGAPAAPKTTTNLSGTDPESAQAQTENEYESAKGCLMLGGLAVLTVAVIVVIVLLFGKQTI